MPVKVEKQGDKYRVVEVSTGRIAKRSSGRPVDGGGTSKSKAETFARIVNTRKSAS